MPSISWAFIIWTVCVGVAAPPARSAPDDGGGARQISPRTEPGDATGWGSAEGLWKLGRQHADRGEHAGAFALLRQLVEDYGKDSAGTAHARIVANALVVLGKYYLDGIPGAVQANPVAAQEFFRYGATYLADAEAQYELGRLLLNGQGVVAKDAVQAAKWLNLSARNAHRPAQALLGNMLIRGEGVLRQAPLGLFWLMLANDGPASAETWIADMYRNALEQTSDADRILAYKHLESWLKDQRQDMR